MKIKPLNDEVYKEIYDKHMTYREVVQKLKSMGHTKGSVAKYLSDIAIISPYSAKSITRVSWN